MNRPKLLFIYPSRGRKERFFKGLDSIVHNLYDQENYFIHVAADYDDVEMNNREVMDRLLDYPNVGIRFGKSNSKIHAINRDLPLYLKADFQVIALMSDDVEWQFYGFDEIIREQFLDGDFDKYVHIPDQDAKAVLSVIYIAGITFVERFGYLYNPEYHSLFCDNEIHEIAVMLGKYRYVDAPGVVLHLNPAYGHQEKDEMFIRQQEIGWTVDQITFQKRKAINFGL